MSLPRPKVFASPERYVQASGCMQLLGQQMTLLGLEGPLVVLTISSMKNALRDVWRMTFEQHGYEYHVVEFGGECSAAEINRVHEFGELHRCKTIVGVGGGKCLDTAKCVASKLHVPMVSCPTVASTDAPCSALAVVYTEKGEFEEYVFPKRHPTLVLCDTRIVCEAPKRLLVGGLGDALATWFEARTVREAHSNNFLGGEPTLTGTALAELCYTTLMNDGAAAVRAVEAKVVTPALERIVEANTLLSGLGFECGGLCTAHSVHNGLTTCSKTHEYTHGEKVSFGLCTQLVLEGRPASEMETVLSWQNHVGLPTTLSDIGVDVNDTDALRSIAERTVQEGETVHNSPFAVTAAMISDAMVAADWIGERFKEKQCF